MIAEATLVVDHERRWPSRSAIPDSQPRRRAPRDHVHAVLGAGRQHLSLDPAREDRVRRLLRDEEVQAAIAVASVSGRHSDPSKSTSRLSAKQRKNVRMVSPPRWAISDDRQPAGVSRDLAREAHARGRA